MEAAYEHLSKTTEKITAHLALRSPTLQTTPLPPTPPPVPTSNRFEVLSSEEDDDDDISAKFSESGSDMEESSPTPAQGSTPRSKTPQPATTPPKTKTAGRRKPPPINVKDSRLPWASFKEFMQDAKLEDFTAVYKNSSTYSIRASSDETYQAVISFLNNGNYYYHTYTRKCDKLIKVVVRGPPPTTSIAEIEKELTQAGLHPTKISNMISRKDGEVVQLPLFLVALPPSEESRGVYRIKKILQFSVRVEKYRNKKGARQCQRCQGYNHSHFTCKHAPRCRRCSGEHITAECDMAPDQPAKCANCTGPHASNAMECPRRPKPTPKAPRTTGRRTYAAVVAQTPEANETTTTPDQQTAQDLLGNLATLLDFLKTSGILEAIKKLAELAQLFSGAK